MASIVISGDTSGSVTLQAPAIAGSTVVTLPTTSMNIGTGGGSVATNTAFGASALAANTTGSGNTGVGKGALIAVQDGSNNTGVGRDVLGGTTSGASNTAMGVNAMISNTTGSFNTAIGQQALVGNTTASNNTAVGYQAGYSNTVGGSNVFVGYQAGYPSTGDVNTVVGYYAGGAANIGSYNALFGTAAGQNSTGGYNTFVGQSAGWQITSGGKNTILGRYSGNQGGLDIRTASNYIVLSDGDGNPRGVFDASGNFLVGSATTFASSKVVIECPSGTQSVAFGIASNVVRTSGTQYGYSLYRDNMDETNAVTFVENGSSGNNAASYVVRTNSATGGGGVTNVSGGVALVQGATSWSSYSDLRLKHDVVPVTNALESILKIDPIFFKWNDRPEDQQRSIGVSAQSVEKVFPELVDRSGVYDLEGGAMQVRYTELIPVLLAAIQELKAIVDAQGAEIAALKGATA